MRNLEEKYLHAINLIEDLSKQLVERPNDRTLVDRIAEAEDALCNLIKENEQDVELLLRFDSEEEGTDDYNSYDFTEI